MEKHSNFQLNSQLQIIEEKLKSFPGSKTTFQIGDKNVKLEFRDNVLLLNINNSKYPVRFEKSSVNWEIPPNAKIMPDIQKVLEGISTYFRKV